MVRKIVKVLIATAIIIPLIGGTCGPPSYQSTGVCGRPTNGAPHIEEVASIIRVTNRPSHDCTPDISPDGKYVAFASWESKNYYDVPARNRPSGDFDIYLVSSIGGGGYQRVTNNPADDYYPAWFPESNRILFTSERTGYPAIWVKHFSGMTGTQKISWAGGSDFGGDVSKQFIVFASSDQLYTSISSFYWHLSQNPIEPSRAGSNPYINSEKEWHPRWHPRIYRMDLNGARLTELGSGIDPQISPDGKSIVYASEEAGSWDIWIMDIDGKRKIQMTSYTGNESDPCWSPDGNWIAYSKSAPNAVPGLGLIDDEYWNIWVTNVNTGENIQKTFSRWFRDLSPCWGYVDEGDYRRDYIYFHSDRDNWENTGFDIYRLDPDMGIEKYDLPDKAKGSMVSDNYSSAPYSAGKPIVRVLNGTRKTDDEVPKWAERVTSKLRGLGYNCLDPKNTFVEVPNYIKIYYGEGYNNDASKIAGQIPDIPEINSVIRKMPANFRWKEEDIIIVLGK